MAAATAHRAQGSAPPAVSVGRHARLEYHVHLLADGPGRLRVRQLSSRDVWLRVDLQNAEGGVNGRKINLSVVDDETNPTLTSTAVQGAISNGAIGIVANSPLFFLAAKYAQQAGVPVTGNSSDGQNGVSSPTPTCSTRSGEARIPGHR